MKKQFIAMLSIAFIAILAPLLVFAQELPPVATEDFIMYLLQSLGGIKGLSTLAIVGIVVQILLKFLATPLFGQVFKKVTGEIKLLIVTILTLIAGVIGLVSIEGLSIGAALVHSSTLLAFSVLLNQIYKQFIAKKE